MSESVTFNEPNVKLEAEIFVADNNPVEILVVANNVPVVIAPELKFIDVTVIFVNKPLATVTLLAARLAVVILPVANNVDVVKPVLSIIDVPVAFVKITLVVVKLLDEMLVASIVEKLPVPLTSNVNAGAVVAIPTFPPVVKILPIVLLLPIALKFVPTITVPVLIAVSTKLVVVIFTTVNVPATFKLPDKLTEPPVIVVALINDDDTVLNVPRVDTIEPVVILVFTILVTVAFVANNVVVEIFVAINEVAVNLVKAAFDAVKLAALINPELIDVDANKVAVVISVNESTPVVNVPVILTSPDTSNLNAGAVVPIPTLPDV